MTKTVKEINELLRATRAQKFRKKTQAQIDRIALLTGQKRPDQSERVSGDNNPMAGKTHPNKGKSLPQIGRPGKKKPASHRENVSKARKGVAIPALQGRNRSEHSILMKDPEKNKGAQALREPWTCVHCNKTGVGLSNYSRWHNDNCKMKPQ